MAISLKALYDYVHSGSVSTISCFTVFGSPNNSAICNSPVYSRVGENFATYDGKFNFTLSKGSYWCFATISHRNNNDDGGGDSRGYIEIRKNNTKLISSANQYTAHWGAYANILNYCVTSSGSDVITVQSYFGGRIGSMTNGEVTFIKLSNSILYRIRTVLGGVF